MKRWHENFAVLSKHSPKLSNPKFITCITDCTYECVPCFDMYICTGFSILPQSELVADSRANAVRFVFFNVRCNCRFFFHPSIRPIHPSILPTVYGKEWWAASVHMYIRLGRVDLPQWILMESEEINAVRDQPNRHISSSYHQHTHIHAHHPSIPCTQHSRALFLIMSIQ